MHKQQTNSKYSNKYKTPSKNKNNNNVSAQKNNNSSKTQKSTNLKKNKKALEEPSTTRNDTLKKQDIYLNHISKNIIKTKQANPQSNSKQNIFNCENIHFDQKQVSQKRKLNQQLKHIKKPTKQTNFHDQQNNQRVEMLKIYLKQDTDRLTHMKKISDEHVISQLKISQNACSQKLKQSNDVIQKLEKTHQQTLLKIHQKHNNQRQQYKAIIQKLKNELCQEKRKNIKLQQTIDQSSRSNKNDYKITVKSEKQKIQKKEQYQQDELAAKLQVLEQQIIKLQQSQMNFSEIKTKLQTKIYQYEKQKKYIRQNLIQVLQFIRNQCCFVDSKLKPNTQEKKQGEEQRSMLQKILKSIF